MLNSRTIKQMARLLDADLCGIAPVERFDAAPAGFRPADLYPDCKSVIVFAKQIPASSLLATHCAPYTHVCNFLCRDVDRLGVDLCLQLEKQDVGAIPIPSENPCERWDPERSAGQGILSLRHAGYLAGLGILGKNTLLINRDFGNLIQLGAVLVDIELEPDPIASYIICRPNCRLCIEACPQQALDGQTVDPERCRTHSELRSERGGLLIQCRQCRQVCPHCLGA